MRWFRLVKANRVIQDGDIISTAYSVSCDHNRWNRAGIHTLYLADSIHTAVLECGRYWLLAEAESFNKTKGAKGSLPAKWADIYQKLSVIEAVIGEVEFDPPRPLLDLSTYELLTKEFANEGFGKLTAQTLLQDSLLNIRPKHLTQEFGRRKAASNLPAMIVPSARNKEGRCCVVWTSNCPGATRLVNRKPLKLFGLDKAGHRIKGTPILDEISFEYEFENATYSGSPMML